MQSNSDPNLDKLYQQITLLSDNAKTQSLGEDYEKSDSSLKDRLILLKQLAAHHTTFELSSFQYQKYQQFLQELKISDAKTITLLTAERGKLIAEGTQQRKRTRAIDIYHKVGTNGLK